MNIAIHQWGNETVHVFVGLYWVDPNQGGIGDAIEVWCNMTGGGQTCVHPNPQTDQVMTMTNKTDL